MGTVLTNQTSPTFQPHQLHNSLKATYCSSFISHILTTPTTQTVPNNFLFYSSSTSISPFLLTLPFNPFHSTSLHPLLIYTLPFNQFHSTLLNSLLIFTLSFNPFHSTLHSTLSSSSLFPSIHSTPFHFTFSSSSLFPSIHSTALHSTIPILNMLYRFIDLNMLIYRFLVGRVLLFLVNTLLVWPRQKP